MQRYCVVVVVGVSADVGANIGGDNRRIYCPYNCGNKGGT
jgi:hypothetical protein